MTTYGDLNYNSICVDFTKQFFPSLQRVKVPVKAFGPWLKDEFAEAFRICFDAPGLEVGFIDE